MGAFVISISILITSRVTPRAASAPANAVNSVGTEAESEDKDGDGNQTSKVVPLEMVAIPWPDAIVVMS